VRQQGAKQQTGPHSFAEGTRRQVVIPGAQPKANATCQERSNGCPFEADGATARRLLHDLSGSLDRQALVTPAAAFVEIDGHVAARVLQSGLKIYVLWPRCAAKRRCGGNKKGEPRGSPFLPGWTCSGRQSHQARRLDRIDAPNMRAPQFAANDVGAEGLQSPVGEGPGDHVIVQRLEDDLNLPVAHIRSLWTLTPNVCEQSHISENDSHRKWTSSVPSSSTASAAAKLSTGDGNWRTRRMRPTCRMSWPLCCMRSMSSSWTNGSFRVST